MNFFKANEKYEVAYANPIRLKTGDRVSITKRETNPEWIGWVFCIDTRGVGGWVSENYLQIETVHGIALRDYDATELTVEKSEVVELMHQEFGWAWVRNETKNEGWVPLKILEKLKPIKQPEIETPRMLLEPITQNHAQEIYELFKDPLLHVFVPLDPPTLEQQVQRCARWEKRRSPDGTEIWLNWAAREKKSKRIIGHF
jgi:hypothetical protein